MTLKEFKEILNNYDENLIVVVDYEGDLVEVEKFDISECEGIISGSGGFDVKVLRILDVDGRLCR